MGLYEASTRPNSAGCLRDFFVAEIGKPFVF